MRNLSNNEVGFVTGGGLLQDAIDLASKVVDAVTDFFQGPSATLENGTTVQCGTGQTLEVTGPDSATCS